MPEKTIGHRTIELSSLDKVFFPGEGLTKGDVVDYYECVADFMLPWLRDRPLAMKRYPDGIEGKSFFQKERPDYFPDWIDHVSVKKEDGTVDQVVCNHAATLVYLANQACLTPHVFLAVTDKPRHPDQLLFDLDPADDGFSSVQFAARALKTLMDEIECPVFCKTSGSRGLHLVVPLDRSADFDRARGLARKIADAVVEREPDRLTTEVRKNARKGRLFIDVLRNAYGQHCVAPYALRARPGAPVATPLDWDEAVSEEMTAQRYTLKNIFRRLSAKQDPWEDLRRRAVSVSALEDRLERLRDQQG